MSGLQCSVIIATYNRSHLLRRLLDSLRSQDIGADAFEVVVIDDGSEDDTQAVLGELDVQFELNHFYQPNAGPAAARNRAIKAARAEIVVSLDDDVVATPSLLRQHLAAHAANPKCAAIGVMALPPSRRLNPWLEWEAVTLQKQYDSMNQGLWKPTARQFYTANASFRRSDALHVDLFDSSFKRAEDVEFAYRLSDIGVTFEFLPTAIVHHEPNRTYRDWLKVPTLYGHYDVTMWRDKGRRHIMSRLSREYRSRHRILRFTAEVLVGRRRLLGAFTLGSRMASTMALRLGAKRVCLGAYSAIFNLLYWQGVCESVGGRQVFWDQMRQGAG